MTTIKPWDGIYIGESREHPGNRELGFVRANATGDDEWVVVPLTDADLGELLRKVAQHVSFAFEAARRESSIDRATREARQESSS